MYLLKIIFFSDRYHLRNFGITATLDDYYAMQRGPVASATLDILKGRFDANRLSAIQEIDEYNVEIKQQEEDELSESFKEAMDFALKEFGDCDRDKLSDISHYYPEWRKHEKELKRISRRVRMNEMDFFENPDKSLWAFKFGKKLDPFIEEDEEFLALQKELYNAYSVSR